MLSNGEYIHPLTIARWPSSERKKSYRRRAASAAAVVFMIAMGVARALMGENAREITIVSRDMAFYIEGGSTANPVIEARAGETLRVVLKNRDRGMTHDFAVPSVDASTDPLRWNEHDEVTFQVPSTPGTYEYVCRPHLLMMKGTLKVVR
jgi:plastocyanin